MFMGICWLGFQIPFQFLSETSNKEGSFFWEEVIIQRMEHYILQSRPIQIKGEYFSQYLL